MRPPLYVVYTGILYHHIRIYAIHKRKTYAKNKTITGLRRFKVSNFRDMATTYLNSCLKSRQYGSAFSGLIHPSDEKVAHMIIDDIDTVFRKAPARFKYEEECSELLGIFRDRYFEMVDDGQAIWDAYMEKIKKNE